MPKENDPRLKGSEHSYPLVDIAGISKSIQDAIHQERSSSSDQSLDDEHLSTPEKGATEQGLKENLNRIKETGNRFPFVQELSSEQINSMISSNEPELGTSFQPIFSLQPLDYTSSEKASDEGHRLDKSIKELQQFPFKDSIPIEVIKGIISFDFDQGDSGSLVESTTGERKDNDQANSVGTPNNLISESQAHSLTSGFDIEVPVRYGAGNETREDSLSSPLGFDVNRYRKDFPVLQRTVHGKPLVWMDNGATTQKPQVVIDAIADYYERYNSNIHRGAHELAREATDAFEEAREKVKNFIGASTKDEIIFVRGTTEGINLVAHSFAKGFIQEGDEIIVSELEHHANIVPWQFVAKENGAKIVVARTDPNGDIMMDEYQQLFNSRTKIVALSQASNAIGTITPAKEMIEIAHAQNVPVLIDAAQSVQHMPVNVQDLDADFFVFSGHKIFAPMGVGVVYGKSDWLEKMPPWQGGGAMIKDVTFEHTEFNGIPTKFEAGTPNVEGPIGLGAALDYLSEIGMPNIEKYEHAITDYALNKLKSIPRLKMIGNPKKRISVLSFVMEGIDNELIGKELDKEGIAVRVGHHCAQPILRRIGYETAVRPALAFYNTREEIDKLADVLIEIERMN